MQLKRGVALVALAAVSVVSDAGRAETPEQWIELGVRVHGGSAPSFRPASASGSMRSSASRPSGAA